MNRYAERFDHPRALYVHVPFCRHRCGYCNFTLIAGRDDLFAAYLTAIERELAALPDDLELDTIFFGGGTPSRLDDASLARLCDMIRAKFRLVERYEWSAEANPLDLTPAKLAILRDCGITRISLGVQSFRAEKLRFLERDHAPEEAIAAVLAARESCASLSLDLMFGVPGETLEDWQSDLDRACELPIDHVSTYGLTIERGSAFYARQTRGEWRTPGEYLEAFMYETSLDRLAAAGFEQYEISNFAKGEHRCRHNETYWQGRGYFACGPGAARYVNGRREINHKSTTTYLQRSAAGESVTAEAEELSPPDRFRERTAFALRMREGFAPEEILAETGYDPAIMFAAEFESMIAAGLLEDANGRIRVTRRGLLVCDELCSRLLRTTIALEGRK